jgi:hypothetical protein
MEIVTEFSKSSSQCDEENLLEAIPRENTDRWHMLIQEVLRYTQNNILNHSSELYGACQHFQRGIFYHSRKCI